MNSSKMKKEHKIPQCR